jgi:hypothetical protein
VLVRLQTRLDQPENSLGIDQPGAVNITGLEGRNVGPSPRPLSRIVMGAERP